MKTWKIGYKILFWVALITFILFGLPFVIRGAITAWGYANPYNSLWLLNPQTQTQNIQTENHCVAKARRLGVPEYMVEAICQPQTNSALPYRPNAPDVKISIGTITFDGESRVWVQIL